MCGGVQDPKSLIVSSVETTYCADINDMQLQTCKGVERGANIDVYVLCDSDSM